MHVAKASSSIFYTTYIQTQWRGGFTYISMHFGVCCGAYSCSEWEHVDVHTTPEGPYIGAPI